MDEIDVDVRDYRGVADALASHPPELIFHLAAQSLVRPSYEDPRGTYETNVMGTVNVLEAARQTESVRVVVNVTSDKCYENREWEWGYREYEPMGGHDPYSSSKGCAELVTAAFRRSFFNGEEGGGLRLASARAGNVIGGGDWGRDRLVPDIMRAALKGEPVRVRDPSALRPWQHVLAPLSGYLMLAQALWKSADYADGWNFGPLDDDSRPVSWIVNQICDLWPEPLEWVADEGEHAHEAHQLKLDSSRARRRLGWAPAWDLEHALERVVQWYGALHRGDDVRAVTVSQIEDYAASP